MATTERLYTLHHPTMRNRTLASPAGDGTQIFVDSEGYVRNVRPQVAEKLSRAGFTLLGSDAGLVSFEGKLPPFIDQCVAFMHVQSAFTRAVREALERGAALEELEAILAKYPRGELVNLRALLGEAPAPRPAPIPAPTPEPHTFTNEIMGVIAQRDAAQAAPFAAALLAHVDAPESAAAPAVVAVEAPAEVAAAEAPADEAPAADVPKVETHWKVKIPVALAMGAQLPDDEKAARIAADAFLAEQPAQAVIDAIEAYRQSRKK